MRGALIQWLREELQRALDRQGESGIVVWYDPGGTLASLAERAQPARAHFLSFTGSYLDLRFALEKDDPHLRGRWVLYIPEPPLRNSWLRDYELLGEQLELDLAELLRRRGLYLTLRLIRLLRERPRNARDLAENWDKVIGRRALSEETIVEALLALAFGLSTWQKDEALLQFLAGGAWKALLEERGLWEEWLREVAEAFGWDHAPEEEPALRARACAAVLLADLTTHLPVLASRFPFLPPDPQRSWAARLAQQWRRRTDLKEAYESAARTAQEEYSLASLLIPEESLRSVETFPCIDDIWLQEIRNAVAPDGSRLPEKAGQIAEIARTRKTLFWASQKPTLQKTWEGLALAAELFQESLNAWKESDKCTQVKDFILHYTDSWWRLDLRALQLVTLADHLTPDDRRRFAEPAWQAYVDWLDRSNRFFAEAVAREGWHPTQADFWLRVGHPRSRTAIFLVDALRYDLARLLADQTASSVRWKTETLMAYLPTLTEIGMSALLPGASGRLTLAVEGEQLQVYLEERPIGKRAEREEHLKAYVGQKGRVISLEDVSRTDWQGVHIAIILSQEVDRLGTFTADLHPAGLLEMVGRLARAIQFLAEQGFEQFFITADHGFLFLPPGVSPGTIPLSVAHLRGRRFAIGGSAEGALLLTVQQQGLRGDLMLAFPRGLAMFALQGPAGVFFHGGLSMQEAIVPLLQGEVITQVVPKVEVGMEVKEPLTSRIAVIQVRVTGTTRLFTRERRVMVEIGNMQSEPVLLSPAQPEQVVRLSWLGEFAEPPSKITIRLLDADTGQVLAEKSVSVQLAL